MTAMVVWLVLLDCAILLYLFLISRTRPFRDPLRNVLICAAHSDDCVILGAEYAVAALRDGRTVHIAYLTCSGPSPEAEMAGIRRTEALSAWQSIGVPPQQLLFLDLPESPVRGPLGYGDNDLLKVRETLTDLIAEIPSPLAIVIPAARESHVDHQTTRSAAIDAVGCANRYDAVVYESPEYNDLLSASSNPLRALYAIGRKIPLFGRLISPYTGTPGFASGPPGRVLTDPDDCLEIKCRMLNHFTSQDTDALRRRFSFRSQYRRLRVDVPDNSTRERRYFPISDAHADLSMCVLFLLSCLTFSAIVAESTSVLSTFLNSSFRRNVLIGVAAVIGLGSVVRAVRRTSDPETSLIGLSIAVGLAWSAESIP